MAILDVGIIFFRKSVNCDQKTKQLGKSYFCILCGLKTEGGEIEKSPIFVLFCYREK